MLATSPSGQMPQFFSRGILIRRESYIRETFQKENDNVPHFEFWTNPEVGCCCTPGCRNQLFQLKGTAEGRVVGRKSDNHRLKKCHCQCELQIYRRSRKGRAVVQA